MNRLIKAHAIAGAPAAAALLGLAGCTVGPDYEAPGFVERLPDAFTATVAEPADTDLAEWWRGLGDDELVGLVERAIEGNPDLAEARERVIEARARRGIANADRLPRLDGEASYLRAQTGDDALILGGAPAGAEVDIFSLGAVAGWEIDLWGRVARLVEAADAGIGFAVEDFRAARVAIIADVAREFVTVRALDAELDAVREGLEADRDSLAIARARAAAGFSDELDVSRATRVLERNLAIVPDLEGRRRDAEIRLAILLGTTPDRVAVRGDGLPRRDVVPALGVPAELLLRRPDIRRAERDLAAANARIGAAVAEYFPRVTVSGSFSLQGTDIGDTVNPDAFVLGVGPTISLPILDGGRIRSSVLAAESLQRQALLRLTRDLTVAIGEVEAAAELRSRAEERVAQLDRAEASAQQTERLAVDRYRAGVVDFLDVTDARTQLLAIRREFITAQRDALLRLVDLYAALGGGWDDPAAAPQPIAAGTPSAADG